MKRERFCNLPIPSCYGLNCSGKTEDFKICSVDFDCEPTPDPLKDLCPESDQLEISSKCVHVVWIVLAGFGSVGIVAAVIVIIVVANRTGWNNTEEIELFSNKTTEEVALTCPGKEPPPPLLQDNKLGQFESISLTSDEDGFYDNESNRDLNLDTNLGEVDINHYETFGNSVQNPSDHTYTNNDKAETDEDRVSSIKTKDQVEKDANFGDTKNLIENEVDQTCSTETSELGYENNVFVD